MRLRIGRHVAVIALVAVIVSSGIASGQERMPVPTRWTIGGVNREALVFPPSRPTGERPPVVFVFQGHGGTMQRMARLGFQQELPEVVIVCPQGIPTASRCDPQGRRSGWQQSPGDEGDRDLAFVDAIVPFGLQERTVEAVCRLNGCEEEGAPWASAGDLVATRYPSIAGAPVIWAVHPGTHAYHHRAPSLIVRFFKEQAASSANEGDPRQGQGAESQPDPARGSSTAGRRR